MQVPAYSPVFDGVQASDQRGVSIEVVKYIAMDDIVVVSFDDMVDISIVSDAR